MTPVFRCIVAILLLVNCSFADEKPNIILIMADDVGIEGLGCYGGVSYRTPHLDRMAGEGIRFTHAYSQPLCTPTRVQLMTGKYNHRNWKSFGILDPNEKTFGHAINIDNLIISGGSAGGHLSLALSTIALEDDPVIEHLPKGLVLFNPVIDLVDGWEGGQKKCRAKGIEPIRFSPAHHVRAGLPPTLILSGSKDNLIPPDLLDKFRTKMTQAGNRCEVKIYPGAGHGFFNYGREDNQYFQPTMWQFEEFLDSVIKAD